MVLMIYELIKKHPVQPAGIGVLLDAAYKNSEAPRLPRLLFHLAGAGLPQHAQIAAALAQGDVEGIVDDRHGADGDDERDDQRQQLDHEDQLIIACNAFI